MASMVQHNAVVGSNHQNDNVGYLGAASTHGGKCPRGPGVSMKVIWRPLMSTTEAPMCCVMPPASPDATPVWTNGVEQRRFAVVDVAHNGNHGRTRLEVFFLSLIHNGESSGDTMRTLRPISSAMSSISSSLMVWVTVRAWPSRNRRLITSLEGTPSKLGELAHGGTLHDLDDIFIEHQAGIDATLHCLLGNALALSGLALLLTLLTTAFARYSMRQQRRHAPRRAPCRAASSA